MTLADQDAEAIRHLRGRIRSLEAENKQLKARLAKLESRTDGDDARSGTDPGSGMECEATPESGPETVENNTTRGREGDSGDESGGSPIKKSDGET